MVTVYSRGSFRVLFIAIVVLILLPISCSASSLYVAGTNNIGIQYVAPVDGIYRFSFAGGASSRYYTDTPEDPRTDANWYNIAHIIKNRPIPWVINEQGTCIGPGIDYYLGDGLPHPSPSTAEQAGFGRYTDIPLNASEYVYLIAPDCQTQYGDNRGGVTVSVVQIEVDPISGIMGSDSLKISLTGSAFRTGVKFYLENATLGWIEPLPDTITIIDANRIEEEFSFIDAKEGLYDVIIADPNGPAGTIYTTLEKAFTLQYFDFKIYNVANEESETPIRVEEGYMVGGNLEFDATESLDQNPSQEFSWDFGDRTESTPWSIIPTAKHVFDRPEKFTVTLNVRSSEASPIATVSKELDLTQSLALGDILVIRSGQPYAGIFDSLGMDYTHVGIYVGEINGEPMVVESTVSPPPLSSISGVQMTPLKRWGYPYEKYVDRLQIGPDEALKAHAADFALDLLNVPERRGYDLFFFQKEEGGDIPDNLAPNRYTRYQYYCSELVWAAYYHASGRMIDLSLGHQNLLVAVSPDDIFNRGVHGNNWHHEWNPPKYFGLPGSLVISTDCPVDIIVTDPSGKTVSNESSEISDAFYFHADMNDDGSIDDGVYITNAINGLYSVRVVAEPGAGQNDTYTLRAQEGNTTSILAEGVLIGDIPTEPYSYRVTATFPSPVPGLADSPTDLNNDDLFEDVNGNGRADFADVVLYFNQMSWIAANEPVANFDYNGNGRIDFADVVWLFNHL
jgi:PKD repeat protein